MLTRDAGDLEGKGTRGPLIFRGIGRKRVELSVPGTGGVNWFLVVPQSPEGTSRTPAGHGGRAGMEVRVNRDYDDR